MSCRAIRALVLALSALAIIALPASAQSDVPGLDGVDELVREHRFGEAREAVEEWWHARGEGATGNIRARALYLRGVLSEAPERSERSFLSIALDHPQSPEASEALLRLGQSRYARGDVEGAERHFERLSRDYPEAGVRARAGYWLGRARLGQGEVTNGCQALESAAEAAAGDRELTATIRELRSEVCASVPPREERRAVAREAAPPEAAPPAREDRARADASAPSGEFVAEAGAFETVAEAEVLRDELRARGHDVLIMRVSGERRTRVWLGPPADQTTIEARARAARSAGFEVDIRPLDG